MPDGPIPGSGQGGQKPQPARGDGFGTHGDGFDLEADMDRFADGIEAGWIQVPPDGPRDEGLSFITAGPQELTGLGVDDLAGLDVAGFAQGGAADAMPPGPVLLALAEAGCAAGTLQGLSDGQVLGLARAGRRLAALGAWVQTTAVAEFAGRRASGEAPGRVAGETISEFASHELAPELVVTDHTAGDLMHHAAAVTRRLPACLAALHAGTISDFQLKIAADATLALSDDDAREADRLIAAAAPSLTPGQLRTMCARTVMMIDPEAARRRKDEAAKDARIERFQEHAGTAALCGRDLPPDEVLASCTHIDGLARQLRAAGLRASLRTLRVRVFLDLTQGKDPRDRLTTSKHSPAAGKTGTGSTAPGSADTEAASAGCSGAGDGAGRDEADVAADAVDAPAWNAGNYDPDGPDDGTSGDRDGDGHDPGGSRAPFPALINLLVPAGTLLGWSNAPGEAAGWGLLDPGTTRDLTEAASRHPATRWCVTVVGPDGTATAHGCARGRHPFDPGTYSSRPGGNRDGPASPPAGTPGPSAARQLAALLGQLQVQLAPIAKGTCDHGHHEDKYEVSRTLKHLVNARTARCVAPGCNRQSAECDADHTVPWPAGPSCECNLGPPCRRHHRAKQAPGWKLEQLSPGIMTWTNPSGRTHTTRPTTYLILTAEPLSANGSSVLALPRNRNTGPAI